MDASVSKTVAGVTALLSELDESFAPFRSELSTLLTQLQTSHTNYNALQEKTKALSSELDAARGAHQEIKVEEDELSRGVKAVNEDTGRLSEDIGKGRAGVASSEAALRDVKGRIGRLEGVKEAGSGWSTDQLATQAALLAQRDAVVDDLNARRVALASLRAEVALSGSQLESAQDLKGETDGSIASVKDEISATRTASLAAQRMKEVKDKELVSLTETVAILRTAAESRTKQADAGAGEVAAAQEALRRDKSALDKCLKEYDKLRLRGVKLADELEGQMKSNAALAGELQALSDGIALSRGEMARMKKEADRFKSLQALAARKIDETAAAAGEVEEKRAELHRRVEELEGECDAERRRNDVKRSAAEDARREKDVLLKGLSRAADKVRSAEEVVSIQDTIRRNIGAEIAAYAATLKRLRGEIDDLQEARAKYALQCDEASGAYFTAVEAVKLQELQVSALQRKIEEGLGKVKQQQALYDAVRADRNMYSKNLIDAHGEIAEMKRTFRTLKRSIDSLKDDITAKDGALIREHGEHHKVEKDKETLRNEVTRVQKQIQSCEQILGNQEGEIAKLNAIIAEADVERARQAKEYEAVVAERNLLQAQLVKRDAELAALYERLRVQKSTLANGAAAYAKMASERDDLAARVAALKGELLVAQTQTSDITSLESEAKRLEADLRSEKTKIRALTEELERPVNIHRWRSLADRDPERWALIQRIHALQKRVLESRDDIKLREAQVGEKEKEYSRLKELIARQPAPEVSEAIATYASNLKSKTKQLRALEGELHAYRERVEEYRREQGRVQERLQELAAEYMARMRAARAPTSTGASGALGGAVAVGAGASDLNMDVSAKMAAAGISSRNGARLPRALVAAVQHEADALLHAYDDVLGAGMTASQSSELGLALAASSQLIGSAGT